MKDDENNSSFDDIITYHDDEDSAQNDRGEIIYDEEKPSDPMPDNIIDLKAVRAEQEREADKKNEADGARDDMKKNPPAEKKTPVKTIEKNVGYDEEYDSGYEFDDEEYEDYKHPRRKERSGILGIVIGAVIGIAAIVAFISVDSGIIGGYKTNVINNVSDFFNTSKDNGNTNKIVDLTQPQYTTHISDSIVVAPDNMTEASIVPYRDGILCATANHLLYINSEGKNIWEINTAIVDPILAVKDNYILLAEKGRKKLCLYSDKKLLYDVDDPDNIMAVKISANGDAVLVTDKSFYRGGISVYNKSGDQIYSWASGNDTVISADISSSSRRVAVALLNTETRVKSTVELFDINQKESYSRVDEDNTVIYDVQFSGTTLTAFGDNRLLTASDGGNISSDISFDEGILVHSAMDKDGNKIMAFDDGNEPYINIYTKRGNLKTTITSKMAPAYVGIQGKYILYNIGRDVFFGKVNNKTPIMHTAVMDIKNLILLSENAYVIVYSNSMEIIKI